MTEPNFTIVNGVKVQTSSIEWVETAGARPDGSRGVKLKNGIFALIPKGEQSKNAQISTFHGVGKHETATFGYNLNNVEISGGDKNDSIWLTDANKCHVITNGGGSDDVRLIYTKQNHGKNVISSDNTDNLTVVEDYYPKREHKLGGNLEGRY